MGTISRHLRGYTFLAHEVWQILAYTIVIGSCWSMSCLTTVFPPYKCKGESNSCCLLNPVADGASDSRSAVNCCSSSCRCQGRSFRNQGAPTPYRRPAMSPAAKPPNTLCTTVRFLKVWNKPCLLCGKDQAQAHFIVTSLQYFLSLETCLHLS